MEKSSDPHVRNADAFFQELDRSVRTPSHPGSMVQMLGRITRGPSVPKVNIVRRGRFYTKAGMPQNIPHSLRFNTRRAAKKFFSRIVLVKSSAQLTALFGAPYASECGINVINSPATMHIDESALQAVLDNKQGELETMLGLTPGTLSKDVPNA